MARIRSIKPEFWTSEQVMECSTSARLLFIGLWNFCDDTGRMAASSKRIKASVFPSDDFTAEDVRRMLDELASNGLVEFYVVDDVEYLRVTGWHHQKIDRPQKSKLPEPPDTPSPNGRRSFAVGREGKGEDRKGRESSGGGDPSPARTPAREAPTRHEALAEPAQAAVEAAGAAAPPIGWNSRENFDRVERRCRAALPKDWVQDLVVSPMARLEADGLDLEREIIPVLLDLAAARRTPIRTWALLANTVAERVAAQRAARTAGGLSPTPPAEVPEEDKIDLGSPYGRWAEPVLRAAIGKHREMGGWVEHMWGPAPGQPGCKIPARLLLGEAA